MSYILDALKKAEVDRKLGEAVSLHDPAPAPAPNWVEPTAANTKWAMGGGALLLLLGTLLAAWWLWPAHVVTGETSATSQHTPSDDALSSTSASATPQPLAGQAPATTQPSDEVQLPIPAQTVVTTTAKKIVATSISPTDTPPQPLPAQIRQQLPPLSVSGAMYADVPSNRMVVINGTLFHEGDTIAPGLVLEHIALKAATLRYQGKAYLLAY